MGDQFSCEFCSNYVFDEDEESYVCTVNMDEDDYYRLMEGRRSTRGCPYFSMDDEYRIVRKQI